MPICKKKIDNQVADRNDVPFTCSVQQSHTYHGVGRKEYDCIDAAYSVKGIKGSIGHL